MIAANLQIVRLSEALPDDLPVLRDEATAEGYRFVDSTLEEWDAGHYAGADERSTLLAVYREGVLAAIGAVAKAHPQRLTFYPITDLSTLTSTGARHRLSDRILSRPRRRAGFAWSLNVAIGHPAFGSIRWGLGCTSGFWCLRRARGASAGGARFRFR